MHLLEIKNLKVHFPADSGFVRILDGIDLWVERNETLGIVGESGCGKTMTARAIMRLIPHPGWIADGEIIFDGRNLLTLPESEMRKLRGDLVAMVFQEPMTSLNPVFRIGHQITEILKAHDPTLSKSARKELAFELLMHVGVPSPRQRFYDYPHQLSGGLRQRVMIAMAIACGHLQLLIADEPTTALDVTTQAQILEQFNKLQQELAMSIILITHDLAIIAEIADRVIVMYAGSVVEMTSVAALFDNTLHPYTQGLLSSLPQIAKREKRAKLYSIPGVVPNLVGLQPGCKFFNRCPYAADICLEEEPGLVEYESGHWVRCVRVGETDPEKNHDRPTINR